jgi:hypothetical protein
MWNTSCLAAQKMREKEATMKVRWCFCTKRNARVEVGVRNWYAHPPPANNQLESINISRFATTIAKCQMTEADACPVEHYMPGVQLIQVKMFVCDAAHWVDHSAFLNQFGSSYARPQP